MDTMSWLILCLLASIGVVQLAGWLVTWRRRPKAIRSGYHVIPLYDDPGQVEAQIRYCLGRIHWYVGGEVILLVDMGLGEESLAICEELMREGALLCCKEERLPETMRRLDELQITRKGRP